MGSRPDSMHSTSDTSRYPHAMCIKPGALASALAIRVEQGYEPTEADLRALIGSGCTPAEIRSALERGRATSQNPRFERALALLGTIH